MCANIAGLFGTPVVGEMKKAGLSDPARLPSSPAGFALGAVFVGLVRIHKSNRDRRRHPKRSRDGP